MVSSSKKFREDTTAEAKNYPWAWRTMGKH